MVTLMEPVCGHRNGAIGQKGNDSHSQKASRTSSVNLVVSRQTKTPGGTAMANRRIEMHHYRQVIHRMRLGQSDRAIAKSKLIGRTKCAAVRAVAARKGWLDSGPLPDDAQLAAVFEVDKSSNQNQPSLIQPHEKKVKQWVEQGIQATTIYEALVTQFGFAGSYSSVRRRVRKIRAAAPKATCMLDFAPGDAAQVDFGRGPTITDVFTGAILKTWIFVMTLCFTHRFYPFFYITKGIDKLL